MSGIVIREHFNKAEFVIREHWAENFTVCHLNVVSKFASKEEEGVRIGSVWGAQEYQKERSPVDPKHVAQIKRKIRGLLTKLEEMP